MYTSSGAELLKSESDLQGVDGSKPDGERHCLDDTPLIPMNHVDFPPFNTHGIVNLFRGAKHIVLDQCTQSQLQFTDWATDLS
jgi:hypothetical protein